MNDSQPERICWVVSDGRAGMENQALGLAQAVARLTPLSIEVKRIAVRAPWRHLPDRLWGRNPFARLGPVTTRDGATDTLAPPWPDLWIACGRLTIPLSAARHREGGTFVVQTQAPRHVLADFDLVVPPHHDGLSGPNVVSIHGAPTRLTPDAMAHDAAALSRQLGHLPAPRIAVLIGGDSKDYRLSEQAMATILSSLESLAKQGAGLMITTSRRTGKRNETLIHDRLRGFDNVFFWQGTPVGDLANPYAGMLGLADHILVTAESTNMVTEAATTGKPVHILPLDGGSPKFEAFHTALAERAITRPLSLPLESWTYEPLRETDRAAQILVKRWLGHEIGQGTPS